MEAKIIDAIPLSLIEAELTEDRFLRDTNKGAASQGSESDQADHESLQCKEGGSS